MIRGLACPYGISSPGGINGKPYCELIEPGAFRASIVAGKCLQTALPIFACLDHDRRRSARLGSVADGRLRLWETEEGVYFELEAAMPKLASGVSVTFKPRRWRKEGLLYRLKEADLVHVAILRWPKRPAYRTTAEQLKEVKDNGGSD